MRPLAPGDLDRIKVRGRGAELAASCNCVARWLACLNAWRAPLRAPSKHTTLSAGPARGAQRAADGVRAVGEKGNGASPPLRPTPRPRTRRPLPKPPPRQAAHNALFPIDYDDAFFQKAVNGLDRLAAAAASAPLFPCARAPARNPPRLRSRPLQPTARDRHPRPKPQPQDLLLGRVRRGPWRARRLRAGRLCHGPHGQTPRVRDAREPLTRRAPRARGRGADALRCALMQPAPARLQALKPPTRPPATALPANGPAANGLAALPPKRTAPSWACPPWSLTTTASPTSSRSGCWTRGAAAAWRRASSASSPRTLRRRGGWRLAACRVWRARW